MVLLVNVVQRVPSDHRVRKVRQVSRERLDHKARRAHAAQQVRTAQQVLLAHKATLDLLVWLAPKAQRVRMVQLVRAERRDSKVRRANVGQPDH